jgi:hypothetical protein
VEKVNVRNLEKSQQGDLAKLLVLAGYTVRLKKERKTPNGTPIPYIEYEGGEK